MKKVLIILAVVVIGSIVSVVVHNMIGMDMGVYSHGQQLVHKLIVMTQGAALFWALTLKP